MNKNFLLFLALSANRMINVTAMQAELVPAQCIFCDKQIAQKEELFPSDILRRSSSSSPIRTAHTYCALSRLISCVQRSLGNPEVSFSKLGHHESMLWILQQLVTRQLSLAHCKEIIELAVVVVQTARRSFPPDDKYSREDLLREACSLNAMAAPLTDDSLPTIESAIAECPFCKKKVSENQALVIRREHESWNTNYTDNELRFIDDIERLWHIACVKDFIKQYSNDVRWLPQPFHPGYSRALDCFHQLSLTADYDKTTLYPHTPHYKIGALNHVRRNTHGSYGL